MEAGKRFKIACIGAGNVGASAAQYCAEMELGDVVLTDILEGFPQGKALDLTQAGPIRGYGSIVTGTNDYADIEGADFRLLPMSPCISTGRDGTDMGTVPFDGPAAQFIRAGWRYGRLAIGADRGRRGSRVVPPTPGVTRVDHA